MSNFVNKVGHFLSPSLHKHSLQGETHGFQHYTFTNPEKGRPSNGGYGADTSSVTSFLMTILSSSNAKYPRHCRSPEAPEAAVCSSDTSATLGSWEPDDDDKEQDPDMCGKLSHESVQELKDESHKPTNISSQPTNLEVYAPPSALQHLSTKLPPLSDESSLLSEDVRAFISLSLPTIAKDRQWILLYSTAKHGTSMRTLYQKCSTVPEPFLLVIGDLEGGIFGGLATAPLKPTAQRKYSGTSDTFVFTNVHKDLQIFKSTGANRYYLLCTNDAISFGGGGHFALHLDDTLIKLPCSTEMHFNVTVLYKTAFLFQGSQNGVLETMLPNWCIGD